MPPTTDPISAPGGRQPVTDEFVARFHPPLVARCVRLTGDADRALDLAQETWLRAVRYGLPADAGLPWLARVARNEFFRGRAAVPTVALTAANDPGGRAGDPARLAERAELVRRMDAALGRLDPVGREVVRARRGRRETWPRAAARHGLSLREAKRRYHAAVTRLLAEGRRGG